MCAAAENPPLKKTTAMVGIFRDGVIALATIVAGLWALAQYHLSGSNAARISYEQNLENSKHYGLQITLLATPVIAHDGRYITGHVDLSTLDSQQLGVVANHPCIFVNRLSVDDRSGAISTIKANMLSQRFVGVDGQYRSGFMIVPGRVVSTHFLFKVRAPGFYLVQFRAPVIFPSRQMNYWGTQSIVHVS